MVLRAHQRHAAPSGYATFRGSAAGLIGGGEGVKVVVERTSRRCSGADFREWQLLGDGSLA